MSRRKATPRTRDVRPTALVRGDERLGPPVTIPVTLRMREWEAFLDKLPPGVREEVRESFNRAADEMDAEIAALEAKVTPLREQLAAIDAERVDVERQLAEAGG